MLDLLSQSTPPSASPDCNLAHNCVNYRVVSARYRRAFCVMLGLRSLNERIYSLYSEAHLVRVGFPCYWKLKGNFFMAFIFLAEWHPTKNIQNWYADNS